ncbi:MAG TPA: two-component regulator propeller domain-containing protein, partial [Candidatus Paceibacterota bacterium]|nr:two-component regulator propeller domain-containing protein [Candidatus Paceibacterota bacterium]
MMVCPQARPYSRFVLRIASLFILMTVICGGYLRAESPPFKSYTTEEGLAHDNVNKIVRDSRGFLWFCTAEGLSRFDGSRFTNFTTDHGLPHRDVNELFELKDGSYLIGTAGGLVVFDPYGKPYEWNIRDQRLEITAGEPPMFRTFAPDAPIRQSKVILSIAELNDGKLLIGTAYGLFRAERINGEIRFEEIDIENGLKAGFYSLYNDSEGGVIAVTSHGIYRIKDGGVNLVDRIGAHSITRAADGRIWVGASGAPTGIRVYELSNGKLDLVERYTMKDGLISDTFQYSICQFADGRIFVGLGNGFQEFVPGENGSRGTFRTISNDIVLSLAQDPVG